jgi:hypothetical protein
MTLMRFRSMIALGAAAFLSGCTSSAKLQVTTATVAPLSGYRTVLVHASSGVDGASKGTIQLEATVAMLARERLSFRQVLTERTAPGAPAELRIDARVVQLKQVTFIKEGLNRGRSGIGRARMIADVTLVDAATRTVIARFTAEGWAGMGRATEDAVRRTAEQIVSFLGTAGVQRRKHAD